MSRESIEQKWIVETMNSILQKTLINDNWWIITNTWGTITFSLFVVLVSRESQGQLPLEVAGGSESWSAVEGRGWKLICLIYDVFARLACKCKLIMGVFVSALFYCILRMNVFVLEIWMDNSVKCVGDFGERSMLFALASSSAKLGPHSPSPSWWP